MDATAVKAIVEANVKRLRDQLRLWDWRIHVDYERLPDGVAAECRVEPAYQKAFITLDYDKLDGEAEVLRVLRHELIHVFCWPAHGYAAHVEEMTEGASVGQPWTFAIERLVWSVESLLDGHDIPLAEEPELESEVASLQEAT